MQRRPAYELLTKTNARTLFYAKSGVIRGDSDLLLSFIYFRSIKEMRHEPVHQQP